MKGVKDGDAGGTWLGGASLLCAPATLNPCLVHT